MKLPSLKRDVKRELCNRLGIEPEQLDGVPQISHQLKSAKGGLPQVLSAIRASEDPELRQFLRKYDSLSKIDQKKATWEMVAVAAGVPVGHLLGNAQIAFQIQQGNISGIIAHSAHPDIVRKRVKMALRDEGIADRNALDTAVGFLPSNKGTSITNRIQVANLSSPEKTGPVVETSGDLELMEDVVPRLHEIRLKALTGRS